MAVSTLKACAAAMLLLANTSVSAQGYRDWRFGMTQAEVSAVGDPSRYYRFKNGDLGAQGEPFEGRPVPISFYFGDGQLTRVMLIPFAGSDTAKARDAWRDAYTHLKRQCTGVELQAVSGKAVELPEALAAFDAGTANLPPGQRHQMGCLPMPAGLQLWASAQRAADGTLMVSVNYGRP